MEAQSQSPYPVKQRDIHFDLGGIDPADWNPNGAHVGHFLNAQSILFPEGEKFFINSVRHYQDRVTDPKLREEVKGFIGQEAMHGREHRAYNAWLEQHGYPANRLERFVIQFLSWVTKTTLPGHRLAATIALEHLTAIMAESLLSKMDHFQGADPRVVALWRWHAIEETEHKAVAFDVYRAAFGSGLWAYLQRVMAFFIASVEFWIITHIFHWQMLKKDGIQWSARGWWQFIKFMWITPGALRITVIPWLAYFRPSFHPWDQDNRQHVERWKRDQEAAGAAT